MKRTTTSHGLALHRMNLQAALNALRERGALTPGRIADELGVQPSTVSRLLSALRGANLIEEGETVYGPSAGRPATSWGLSSKANCVLALEIGPDRLQGAVVGLGGEILDRAADETRTQELSRASLQETIVGFTGHLIRQAAPRRVLGVGVVVSGVVDPKSGAVLQSGGLGLKNYPLRDLLLEQSGLGLCAPRPDAEELSTRPDAAPLHIANDAKACALVTFRHLLQAQEGTPGTDSDTFPADGVLVYLMASDDLWGFGSGTVAEGRLFTGAHGGAGEVLHSSLFPPQPPWAEHDPHLAEQALAGDPEAIKTAIAHLGPVLQHLASLVLHWDPDRVVLGGAFGRLGEPLKQELAALIRSTRLLGEYQAELPERGLVLDPQGDRTVLLGAAELALSDLFRRPDPAEPGRLVQLALGGQGGPRRRAESGGNRRRKGGGRGTA